MGQKETLLAYARRKFGSEPDYPWAGESEHAVLRHADSGKWYALFMRLPGKRLGFNGPSYLNIINLKADPMVILALLDHPAVLPAYHMNKTHWVTIILDGRFPDDELQELLESSHVLTGSRRRQVSRTDTD